MLIRKPAVAGQFYPGNPKALKEEVKKYLRPKAGLKKALGVISPHAGYMYSGRVAGETFSSITIPETCIILSPNHTGMGSPAAIMTKGTWEIPTGMVPIDTELAERLLESSSVLSLDAHAHIAEHSLEVQLPFLLELRPDLKIVPITLSHLNYGRCGELGFAIAKTLKEHTKDILIVASSDMTHYESDDRARVKDNLAIDKVLSLDPRGLLNICAERRITMCGVIPATVMLIACKELGATKAELVKYATSGDITGDKSAVVGYAGMVVL